jgi:3-hydroxy-5-methyl-1-naphthoate 3-O-methyltransferase
MESQAQNRSALETVDPSRIFRYREGVYTAYLLAAAIVEFDFFTWLDKNPASLAEICSGLGIAERPTDVMLTLFQSNGFITQEGDRFTLTDTARTFLTSESPYSLLTYYTAPFATQKTTQEFIHVLRTDEPDTSKDWHELMENDAFAESSMTAMDRRGMYLGEVLAKKISLNGFSHLLDVGGGSGAYACCFVENNPQLRATVLEKPPVDKWTRQFIEKRELSSRISVMGGDMFTTPYPPDCDVHFFSLVIHDWGMTAIEELMKKSFDTLPSGGLLMIHDAHLNNEKNGPMAVAEYSAFVVHHVARGRCYSFGELKECLEKAGFSTVSYSENACDRSIITARKD